MTLQHRCGVIFVINAFSTNTYRNKKLSFEEPESCITILGHLNRMQDINFILNS